MRAISVSYKDKWVKTQWLMSSSRTRPHIPVTKKFDKDDLQTMLNRYSTVYFKPADGTGGSSIIRLKSLQEGGFQSHYKFVKKRFSSLQSLYEELDAFSGTRPFLLQQGIQLARTKGKPFDIRVMVQKNRQGQWTVTGMFAKIGKAGRVVNNYHQGGRVGRMESTLTGAGFAPGKRERIMKRLNSLGLAAARCFDKKRKNFYELGLDVGLDVHGKLWIIEVNTRPQYFPVKRIDRGMFNRIERFAQRYRRKRKKKKTSGN